MQVSIPAHTAKYRINIGSNLLSKAGKLIQDSITPAPRRIAIISNRTVFALYGHSVTASLKRSGFAVTSFLIPDGEQHKSFASLQKALSFLGDQDFQRTDAVVALGGGVDGDLAGFAAATYLRGIALVQIPTTLLAQIDASIGGKVGVNLPSGKNRVGAFHQPSLVITDVDTLNTLPPREMTAGWCECVKQGAVANRKLFNQTLNYLQSANNKKKLEELIAAHCAFKVLIVEDDVKEDVIRTDRQSRRILNFGHTVGHALEALTNYRRFRHGEAVGYGILTAAEISKNLGLLDKSELELLREAVGQCGSLPIANDLNVEQILQFIGRDKKRSGDHVQWVLLEKIGKPIIVSGEKIRPATLKKSIRDALQK